MCHSKDIWAFSWIHAPLEVCWVSGQAVLSVTTRPSSGPWNLGRESTHSCQDPFLSRDSLACLPPAVWCTGVITVGYEIEANTIEGAIRQEKCLGIRGSLRSREATGLRQVISRFALCKKKKYSKYFSWLSLREVFTCLAAFNVSAPWRRELWSLPDT